MPAYSKTNWVDGSVPAIDATNLNKMEQGIFDAFRQDGSTTMSGQLVTTAGSVATPAIAPTGDANTGIFFPAADTIAFGEGGLEAMRINSAGNVGIGTTNPSYKLDVRTGSASFEGSSGVDAVRIAGAGGSWFWLDNPTSTTFRISSGSVAGTNPFILTSAGNVGIGTSSISSVFGTTLKVAGSTGATVQTIATNVNLIQFTSDALSLAGFGTVTNHPLQFLTSDIERMRIDSSGNVGIGTNSPSDRLHIKGVQRIESTNAPTSNHAKLQLNASATVDYGLLMEHINNGVTDAYISIGGKDTVGNIYFGTNTAGNSATTRMTITSAGNVGIGTASPNTILQVDDTYGGYRAGIIVKNTADGATGRGTGIEWHSGTGTTKGEISLTAIDANRDGYDMKFQTTATGGSKTTKMTITGAGNVGIGTTSPSVKLQVVDASDAKIQSVRTGGCTVQIEGGGSAGFLKTTTNHNLVIGTNNADSMTLTTAGYLLIGYTSSNGAYPLQVNGQIFATSSTIATSDGRYKKDVVALDGALDIVKALNPVQFSWKDHPVHKFNTDVPTVGFIAQEVEQALADKSYLTSIIKKSECTWETETGEFVEREVTRDVEKQVTREVEREITETIDGEEVTRTITEEVTETVIEQVTEIVTEPVKETHTEEFLGIAESNLIAILTKAVKELNAKVEALEAQLNK